MEKAQEKFLYNVWKEKPKNFILKNKNELLILASIIQKESSKLEDSKLVASVFINRLKKKMKLQSDVTLAFGFKVNGQKITRKMLNSKNLFNTYQFHGLPPTPISYPGENALNSLKDIKNLITYILLVMVMVDIGFPKLIIHIKKILNYGKINKLRINNVCY